MGKFKEYFDKRLNEGIMDKKGIKGLLIEYLKGLSDPVSMQEILDSAETNSFFYWLQYKKKNKIKLPANINQQIEDIITSDRKTFKWIKASIWVNEESQSELESLISIVKNPYPGKYATEVSYDDAVQILKDKYDYTDEMIEEIKKVVENN